MREYPGKGLLRPTLHQHRLLEAEAIAQLDVRKNEVDRLSLLEISAKGDLR